MSTRTKACIVFGSVLIAACANKEPVKVFSTSAESLTNTFNSYASNAKATCQKKYIYQELTKPAEYIAQANNSTKECQDYDQAFNTLQTYSSVVSSYAKSLGVLAGLEPSVFDDNINGIMTKVSKLENSGGKLVDQKAVDAATKLLNSVSQAATGIIVDQKIKRELRDNHKSLVAVIKNMKEFEKNLQSQLNTAKNYANEPLARLVDLSYSPGNDKDQFLTLLASGTFSQQPEAAKGARLPYRLAQAEILKQQAGIDAEKNALSKFSEACDALIDAHSDLKNNFGELSKEELLEEIKNFYEKAKEARENFIVLRA
ncbi:hypothetical protein [Pseudomonas sp. QTF5]|uniref:hypothetical protein n=1 Tax=Pseudomonas sp. QTF5 TaxID=1435425 RepID=UPI00117B9E54|nr:hypothetical protein [Pseudomonas sp. QTF5]